MRVRGKSFIVPVLALALAALSISAQQRKEAPVAVIVNSDNPIDSISTADLRKIYYGDKESWGGGLSVTPIVRSAPAHERDVLLKDVLKLTDAQFQEFWVKKIYSGQSVREPLALMSTEKQLEAVRSHKGGIALVNAQEIRSGVKILKVDGLLPGAAGYALK